MNRAAFAILYSIKRCFQISRLSTHSVTSLCDTPEEKRSPSSQLPVPASSSSSSPLCPRPEEEEVQNGITVFPVKSFACTNVSTGHAAMPHQIG